MNQDLEDERRLIELSQQQRLFLDGLLLRTPIDSKGALGRRKTDKVSRRSPQLEQSLERIIAQLGRVQRST